MQTHYTRSDKFIMIMTSFIALTALVVSIWQGIEMRKHNRLSVKPLFTFTRNFNKTTIIQGTDTIPANLFQLYLSNNGTGPGIISEFKVYYKDQIVDKYSLSLWNQIFEKSPGLVQVNQGAWYDPGDVVSVGERKSIVRVSWIDSDLKNIRVYIKYHSIYEEEYDVSINLMD